MDFYVAATPDVPADTLEVVHTVSPAASRTSPSGIRRIVAASLVGTTIEWYDNSPPRAMTWCFVLT
ncbi:hypothetical protein ACIPW5_22745 [Streptomyces sp. NPDC090077]|uniref:hypothetical protein n=1 Tax=Streptomyces sp. NPDC090077 TaxID=3365938 RepID=UPI00380C0EC5